MAHPSLRKVGSRRVRVVLRVCLGTGRARLLPSPESHRQGPGGGLALLDNLLLGQALIAALVLLPFLGGPPFEAAALAAPPEAKAGRLALRAVDAATGKPIEGATIEHVLRFVDKAERGALATNENGAATIKWKAGAKMEQFSITARKAKFAPLYFHWRAGTGRIRLPESLELRFEPGTTIGGIVQDEAGQPIQGATVVVIVWINGSGTSFPIGRLQTDAQGRWRLDDAPSDLEGVSAFISHPDHRRALAVASHNLNSVCVLPDGLTLKGRIVDGSGRPVSRAEIVMGTHRPGHPVAVSDAHGDFTLKNCAAGPNAIIVQARGFAPQIRDVRVEKRQAKPLEVRMTERAATLRVRIVDGKGMPVPGVAFSGSWRSYFTLRYVGNTDKDGRFVCRDAPKDALLFDLIAPAGYLSIARMPLTASEQEQTIVLHPELVVSGNVTDVVTGQPIEKFRVVRGRRSAGMDGVQWFENIGEDGSGGRFVSRSKQWGARFDDPSEAWFIRIEAPGHKPEGSRPFRPDEGAQIFDFALKPDAGIAGTVELPDGRPAAGVDVALTTPEGPVTLQSGRFQSWANVLRAQTGADGRFAFQPPDGAFVLIVADDAGYAEISSDAFRKAGKLVLQPWGRIEGGVRIGARMGAGQRIQFRPDRLDGKDPGPVRDFGYVTTADDRGRFAFERVVPGPGAVSRVVLTRHFDDSSTGTSVWQAPIDVQPGRTSQVVLGGKGRPVIGRAVLDDVSEPPIDWARNLYPAIVAPSSKEEDKGQQSRVQFAALIDQDGRFRVEDVPPGRYELKILVFITHDLARPRSEVKTREIVVPFTMPEIPGGRLRSNEPLDLGDVRPKMFKDTNGAR